MCDQDDYEERRVRHEAAHFLAGYLCGLPIKSYRADGGTTLVEFYDSVDGDLGGRALKFTPEEVDQVCVCVSVPDLCSFYSFFFQYIYCRKYMFFVCFISLVCVCARSLARLRFLEGVWFIITIDQQTAIVLWRFIFSSSSV